MSAITAITSPPEGVREGNENLVRLTAEAGGKVAALIAREAQGDYLRIAITGGGCNGLSYKLRFVPEPRRGDILVRSAVLRRLERDKLLMFVLQNVKPLMSGDEILHLDLQAEIEIEASSL